MALWQRRQRAPFFPAGDSSCRLCQGPFPCEVLKAAGAFPGRSAKSLWCLLQRIPGLEGMLEARVNARIHSVLTEPFSSAHRSLKETKIKAKPECFPPSPRAFPPLRASLCGHSSPSLWRSVFGRREKAGMKPKWPRQHRAWLFSSHPLQKRGEFLNS